MSRTSRSSPERLSGSSPRRARRPGRPRSAAAHDAIRRAALALFIEHGIGGTSIEAVAAKAGVGKASIYRRWQSKEALLINAVIDVFAEPARPDTGTVREDLIHSTKSLLALMSSSPAGDVFPRMAAEVARHTTLGQLYGKRVIGPRRLVFGEALRRGVARGELPETIDVELAIDCFVGPLLLRKLTRRLQQSDRAFAERTVDLLLSGLRSRTRR